MRFSTQEFLGGSALLNGTPALGGAQGFVPNFTPNVAAAEGIFVYDAKH
ncbi:MAG: hypothetical protein IPI79_11910 [Moraxellaceae bacterium]|nr:hypothetical protein [Moraxellaceae bacterium]